MSAQRAKKIVRFAPCLNLAATLLVILLSFFLSSPGHPSLQEKKRTELGNERFIEDFPPELQGRRLGLVINHTSQLPGGMSLIQALLHKRQSIKAIFTPEHGFGGDVVQGVAIEDSRLKSIKIYSLYGKTRKPTPEQTGEIDAFIYDIQDVGTRFYTYITTLKYVMEAAAEAKRPVYVLDRPNPAGGVIIEGPLLQPQFESFIGAFPIPLRYGLTVGELALMMKGESWVTKTIDLHVVEMKNWRRAYFWKDTGLGWLPTSPNMPTPKTAIAYPGTGLLGALKINQGLGTPSPFLQFGAPWLGSKLLIQRLKGGEEYGVDMEAVTFIPQSLPGKVLHPPYENRLCQGIRIHIRNEDKFLSLRFTLDIIKALKEFHPERLAPVVRSLNMMFGNDLLFLYLEGQLSFDELITRIEKDENLFRHKCRRYLLYQ